MAKTYSVSLCLSIEADSEEEARELFDEALQFGKYEDDNIDCEEEAEEQDDEQLGAEQDEQTTVNYPDLIISPDE